MDTMMTDITLRKKVVFGIQLATNFYVKKKSSTTLGSKNITIRNATNITLIHIKQ